MLESLRTPMGKLLKDRYFSEGVSARCWSTDGKSWHLQIDRTEGHVYYSGLDPLKREVLRLKSGIEQGSRDLRLIKERYEYPEDEMEFDSAETAAAVIVEIAKAVAFLATTPDEAWHEVPADVFAAPRCVEPVVP